jgi:hypothetical protein
MARARNIKPAFFTNEELGTLDPIINLTFIGLWCLADKEGILEDRPLRIKAELFPYRDSLDINGYLTVLAQLNFIERYEVEGKAYIHIVNFEKHQSPHHTEKAKGYPKKPKENNKLEDLTVKQPLDHQNLTVAGRSDSLIPDSLIPDSIPYSPQTGTVDVSPKKKTSPIALQTYLDQCKSENRKPIPEDDPVFSYTEKVGIPEDLLRLHWIIFKKRHTESGSKRQRDWCQKFRNSVEGNWYKIWYIGADGVCRLSSIGQQAQIANDERAAA